MINNYFIRGFVIASTLTLLSACQHFNNSYSKNPRSVPMEQVTRISNNSSIASTAASIDKKSASETQAGSNISLTNVNDITNSDVFANLADNATQVEARKELLMSLSKPGENLYRDAAEKRKRKLSGIRLPGEVSGIVEMANYRRALTMPIGTEKMLYKNGFLSEAFEQAIKSPILERAKSTNFKTSRTGTYSLANVVFRERGPKNIPGRGRGLLVSPINPNKWYNATAGGGIWITEEAGVSWRNTTDFSIPNLGTSTIAISPNNPNIVYAGTGEPFGNLDRITGSGVVKSTDAGETWALLANTAAFGSVGRLLVNPANANIILVASSLGIYRSVDGGDNWTKTYEGTATNQNVQDLKANADFTVIYGAVNNLGVVKSTDGGVTWSLVFDAAANTIKRIELAVSPVDNDRIFLSVENTSTEEANRTGMYMSSDAGDTWNLLTYDESGDSRAVLGSQGWYDNVITAHPTDINVAYVGGISVAKITVNPDDNTYVVKSIASGYDRSKLNTYVHPDQHGIVCQVDPNDPTKFRLLLNNDGGVWYTDYKTNPGETQNDFKAKASGLNNTQFYGADKKKGADAYLGGMQDNGSAATKTSPSSATSSYLPLLSGDGFEVIWNYNDTNKLIYGAQYNNFYKSVTGVQDEVYIPASNLDKGSQKSPFYSKLANANNNPDVIFTVSSTGVWKSADFGTSWSVSKFSKNDNGSWLGNTSYATVKVSVANPDVVWAASAVSAGEGSTYKVNISKDNGTTFTKTTGSVPINSAYYVSGLAASSVNPAQAYTLFSGAGQPKIVKTSDYGATWVDITGFFPAASTGFPDVPVNSLIEMPFDTNVLWAGTHIGVFETTDGGANWYLVTAVPPVSVWNMKIVDDQVVLATHGRGIWTATIPELSNYTLPVYIKPPTVKSAVQFGIHDMRAKAVFNYTDSAITGLKVFVDNVYHSTISNTLANTDYTVDTAALTEGAHTISVSGLYDNGAKETVKNNKPISIINFNAGAQNVNIPTFTSSDVYTAADGKFVVNNLDSKFTYDVLNNSDHPYKDNTNYETYLRTPIIVGADSKEVIKHMVFTEKDYDFAVIEASSDLVNWVPVGSYDESSYPEWNSINTAEQVTEDKFKNSDLDFPSKFNAGEEIVVRLRLTADPGENRFGWVIKSIIPKSALGTSDNIVKGEKIFIAPNPADAHADLYLPSNLKGDVTVGIYDISGKVIKTLNKPAASKISLDLQGLNRGVYLVLVKTEAGNKALKLIKK